MPAEQVAHYIRRATDFLEGMQLTRGGDQYWNSAALLAIHSAVSFSDALRTGLEDSDLSSDDHRKAAEELERVLSHRGFADRSGLRHLRFLLKRKNHVTYQTRRIERTDYEALFLQDERFARWADTTSRGLKIEGWRDGDQ